MKRRTASVMTVVLFALIAVCFLRPEPGKVWRPSDMHEIELIGKDAGLLKAYMYDHYTEHSAILHFESADPNRYYTIGSTPWRDGREMPSPSVNGHIKRGLGTLYRLENGEWVEFDTINYAEPSHFLIFTGIPDRLVAPESIAQFSSMPFCTPGTYRAMYYFYEYFLNPEHADTTYDKKYSMGSSGKEIYEVGFEFTVPEATNKPIDAVCLHTQQWGSENCTRVYTGYRINSGAAVYPQPDSIKLEKWCGLGFVELDSLGDYRDLSDEIYDDAYTDNKEAFCVDSSHIKQGAQTYEYYGETSTRVSGVYAFMLKPGTVYRLRVTFTENEDGSGAKYETKVKFQIN